MVGNTLAYTLTNRIIRHPCDQTHTLNHKHSHPPTGTCGQARPGPHSRQETGKKRREKTGRVERRRRSKVLDVLTPFLKPSLSNDGDIAHGSFTPSLMLLHACSTEREGGGEERRRGEKERERRRGGGGRLSQPRVTLPPFLSRSPSRSRSLSLRHTHKHPMCMCVVLLPVVAYLPASLPSSSPPPPPPPPPLLSFPLQTFLLTSSDSVWKEVKREKNKEKRKAWIYFSSLLLLTLSPFPSVQNPFMQFDKTNN